MRCEQALVRVCDGLREDGEVDWQIARAARVKIVRNSASMNRGLGGRGGRRTARSAAFMAHLNRPGLKKCNDEPDVTSGITDDAPMETTSPFAHQKIPCRSAARGGNR